MVKSKIVDHSSLNEINRIVRTHARIMRMVEKHKVTGEVKDEVLKM